MKKYVLFLLILLGCSKHNKIEKLLKSNDKADIMRANYLIGETRDTTFVCSLLKNLNDPRVTHHYRFKGMTVYYTKIGALIKISNMQPPKKVRERDMPDSLVIKFYIEWAKKNGYNCH